LPDDEARRDALTDAEWIKYMAEKEDNCDVSVGHSPTKEQFIRDLAYPWNVTPVFEETGIPDPNQDMEYTRTCPVCHGEAKTPGHCRCEKCDGRGWV
jgi:DnaJ-class molecular chaperone